jgi:hypothetical protein
MLGRRMEIDVADVHSRSYRYAKGLNGPIQVHVKESILIVPDAGSGMSHLITHIPDAIVTRIRLNPGY